MMIAMTVDIPTAIMTTAPADAKSAAAFWKTFLISDPALGCKMKERA